MIKRVLASFFLVELFVALAIYLVWVSTNTEPHVVELGGPFLSFLRQCSDELNDFKIEIPSIPQIPVMDDVSDSWLILNVVVSFFNGFINILNFVVLAINTIIQVIQFLVIVLKNFIALKDMVASS